MAKVWDILLDWAIQRQDKSFIKSVNRSSRDKILQEYVIFTQVEKFKAFIVNFSTSSAYTRIKSLKIKGIVKNLYDDFPKDWILLIFQLNLQELHLDSLEWVGESLFSRISIPANIQSLSISNLPITAKTMEHLLSLLPFLTILALDNLRCVNDRLLEFFPIHVPNLKYLSLGGASITSKGIAGLFGFGLDYRSSQNFYNSEKSKVVENKTFKKSCGLNQLESLNISECFFVDDDALWYLASSECELKDLKLRGLNRISSYGINQILVKNYLESLDISQISSFKECLSSTGLEKLKISSGALSVILPMKNLLELEVYLSKESSLELLSRVISQNPRLERLILVKDHSLGMFSLNTLQFNPSNFKHIDIRIVSNEKGRFV